jgi:signal transduction histidine kinase
MKKSIINLSTMEKNERNSPSENEIERLNQIITKLREENDQWKNKMLSIVSHEFKTPLSTIKLAVNYLLKYRERIEPHAVGEKLEAISLQTDHLVYSVNSLKDIKVEANDMKTSKHAIDVVSFFVNLKNDIERKLNWTHTITLEFDLVKNEIETDEELLRSIFTNVLNNAIKFSPSNSTVHLQVRSQNENIEVTVKDNGLGIDAHDLPKIFNSFYRGSNSKGITGMGLGLAIVKKGVEMLNGIIRVTSELGRGSTFSILIPE